MTGAAGLPPASDWDTSNTAEEAAVPMQLTASHRYTDTGFSRLACRANTSPATRSYSQSHRTRRKICSAHPI